MRSNIGRTHRPYVGGTQFQSAAFNSTRFAPLLDMNFLSGSLDPRITFTRTTSATFVNSLGYVASASTNVARFTHDPVTKQIFGLLIEGGITNLACGSETFATSGGANNWADTNITRDSTNNADPANGTTALRVTASAGNATILNNLSLTSAARTFSLWLRRVGGTGDIEWTMDGGTTWTAQAITSSWVRYAFTATSTAHVGIRIVSSGDSIELWGAQVEAQGFVSSYIPTTTATIARGADSALMTGANFLSWQNRFEGTVLIEYGGLQSGAIAGNAWQMDNGTNNERHFVVVASPNSTSVRAQMLSGGSTQATFTYSPVTVTLPGKNAFAYATNNVAGSQDGGDVQVDSLATMPLVDRLAFGSSRGAASWLNAPIARWAYWPTRLSNATLQELTA